MFIVVIHSVSVYMFESCFDGFFYISFFFVFLIHCELRFSLRRGGSRGLMTGFDVIDMAGKRKGVLKPKVFCCPKSSTVERLKPHRVTDCSA